MTGDSSPGRRRPGELRVDLGAAPGVGPGIPRQDRDRVFQPFQRLVDHGTGVGLGLAISRGFVDAMGGELTIEDTPSGGVTMVVGLPVAPVALEGADETSTTSTRP